MNDITGFMMWEQLKIMDHCYGIMRWLLRGYLASGPSRVEIFSWEKPMEKPSRNPETSLCTFVGAWWYFCGFLLQVLILWMDEPLGACHWFPIEKNSWIQDSMPTRKKRGVAGKCTLPAGFVHNHTQTCLFFRFVWSFARVCLGLLRSYWDLSEGWPIFGIWVDFLRFLWDFDRHVLMLKCLGLLWFGQFLRFLLDLLRFVWGLLSIQSDLFRLWWGCCRL